MKMLQVAYKSDITGGEMVILNIMRGFIKKGHSMFLIVPTYGDLLTEAEKLGVKCFVIPFSKTYSFSAVRKIANVIKRYNIDVVLSHSMIPNVLSRLSKIFYRDFIHISTVHLILKLTKRGRNKNLLQIIKDYYYKFVNNVTSYLDDGILAISYGVREDLLEQGIKEDKIVVIQNGIDVDYFDRYNNIRDDKDTLIIGTIARLSPQKDLFTFVDMTAIIHVRYPEIKFRIIGDGMLKEDISEYITSNGLDSYISMVGYQKDIPNQLQKIDIFVLSSLWEGLPLTVLEAMAMRLPVVATNIPGTNEAVVHNRTGFLVSVGDYTTFAERCVYLIEHPDIRHQMGIAGYNRVRTNFSINIFNDRLEDYFMKTLAERT